ncbi:MAG TPA: glycosyltransferase 87 family protein [Candidatus Dormibacteraeota bacterium]|nr:glycosyltransferase 87 family protein [Candidatus Dormibacteraeota bacterium]
MRWRRRGRFAVLAALFDLTLFNVYQIVLARVPFPDFAFFYAFGRATVTDGYQHLYDRASQRHWDLLLFPGSPDYPIVNPPPFGALMTPFALLPFGVAFLIWTAAMVAAIAVASQIASPPGRYFRALYLASWLGFLPAYLVFVDAPLGPLMVLTVVAAWKLLALDRQTAAGLVLAVGLLKPTLLILVPLALLAAGYRRAFAAWLVAAVVAVAASLAVLGPHGVASFISLSRDFAGADYYLRWSLVPLVGDGAPWAVAAILITCAVLLLALATRHQGLEVAISIGVMGSVLVNHHMTPGDLMILLVPVWLLLRAPGSVARDVLVGLAWIAGWAGLIFTALVPLVAAATLAGLFVQRVLPERARIVGAQKMADEGAR